MPELVPIPVPEAIGQTSPPNEEEQTKLAQWKQELERAGLKITLHEPTGAVVEEILDRAPEKFSRGEYVFLSDKFFERARSYAGGERRGRVRLRNGFRFVTHEKIVHEQKYDGLPLLHLISASCSYLGRHLSCMADAKHSCSHRLLGCNPARARSRAAVGESFSR